eukprot:scaffold9302_cov144-Skeletonema_dohrnii-CCMP3373.AAC.1
MSCRNALNWELVIDGLISTQRWKNGKIGRRQWIQRILLTAMMTEHNKVECTIGASHLPLLALQ